MKCVACRLVEGSLPVSVVRRGERVTVVVDLLQLEEVDEKSAHLLVLPNEHYERLAEMPEEVRAEMFMAGTEAAKEMKASNLFLNDGREAGQELPHVHLHVLGRREGDGFKMTGPWTKPSRKKLEQLRGEA